MSEPGYRPEFLAALDLLAKASERMASAGRPRPILVGGAVVEFDTLGAVTSGDFDVVAADEVALASALEEVGFRREDRPGRRLGGWYHPELPIAVDCVSTRYYGGLGDRGRIRAIVMPSGEVRMAPIEEIIADRIAQWDASGRRDDELAEQVSLLIALAPALDGSYVLRRVEQDTGTVPDLSVFTPRPP